MAGALFPLVMYYAALQFSLRSFSTSIPLHLAESWVARNCPVSESEKFCVKLRTDGRDRRRFVMLIRFHSTPDTNARDRGQFGSHDRNTRSVPCSAMTSCNVPVANQKITRSWDDD